MGWQCDQVASCISSSPLTFKSKSIFSLKKTICRYVSVNFYSSLNGCFLVITVNVFLQGNRTYFTNTRDYIHIFKYSEKIHMRTCDLITSSIEQSFLRNQWFINQSQNSRYLSNSTIHYYVHMNLQVVPILSQIKPVHIYPSHPTALQSILLLSSHLHLGFLSWGFPIKTLLFLFSTHATCSTNLIPFDLIMLIIFGEKYK